MDVESRLEALEQKVSRLEDRAAIFQLMASYGPAVDSLNGKAVAALWMPDGAYHSDALVFACQDGLTELVQSDFHQQVVKAGSAHIVSLPHLEISGDTAVATNYTILAVCQADQHQIARASANRRLNGDASAQTLLGRIFSAP